MEKRMLRTTISLMLVLMCVLSMAGIVNAETKRFNVTASNMSGVQSPDPLTPRAQKNTDGDNKFYVTLYSMNGTCNYVMFYMNRYTDLTPSSGNYVTYSHQMYYYRSSVGSTKTQVYGNDTYAPGNYYYFMKCVPEYGYAYINCTGQFTP